MIEHLTSNISDISYAAASALSLVTAFILHEALREVIALGAALDEVHKARQRHRRSDLPSNFTGRLVGSADELRAIPVRGRPVILFFIDYRRLQSPKYLRELRSVLFMLEGRRHGAGTLLVVCRGSEEECTRVRQMMLGTRTDIPIIVDRKGELGSRFAVDETPAVLVFDAEGRFIESGQMRVRDS